MKIVIVIDSWKEGNGNIVTTRRMVKEMERRGHQISIVTTGVTGSNYEGDFYEVPGFYLPGVKESMENMGFLFAKPVKKTLREAFTGADLIQIQFPFFIAKGAIKMAKKMGIPVVAGCHIQPQNVVGAMGKENALMESIMMGVFNHYLFKKVDWIHCPSEFAANMLRETGNKAELTVVSNGIPNEYVPQDMDRPAEWGDKFVIMNIGRHALEKRQDLLLEGVKRSKHADKIKLLLCGKGERTEILKEKGKELPVEPYIEYITMEQKLQYMNTADLYAHASVIELESLACLEAIGCGLPCLIGNSPNSAAPQFALDDRFIFEVDDADHLAARIDYWVENRQELKNLKTKALEMAEKYRFDRCMTQMEEFHQNAVDTYHKTSKKTVANRK